MEAELGPRLIRSWHGAFSLHATTVSLAGRSLAIAGPAGSGKSVTAAQMMAGGADLIVDDLTVLTSGEDHVVASAPEDATPAIELRGIGIVPVRLASAAPLAGVLWLTQQEGPRLPDPEFLEVGRHSIPLIRHPARFGLAAKMLIWLAAPALRET